MSAVLYYYPSVTGTLFSRAASGVVVYDANTSPKLESGGLGINVVWALTCIRTQVLTHSLRQLRHRPGRQPEGRRTDTGSA